MPQQLACKCFPELIGLGFYKVHGRSKARLADPVLTDPYVQSEAISSVGYFNGHTCLHTSGIAP